MYQLATTVYIHININYHLFKTFRNPKDNNDFLLIHKTISPLNQRRAAALTYARAPWD